MGSALKISASVNASLARFEPRSCDDSAVQVMLRGRASECLNAGFPDGPACPAVGVPVSSRGGLDGSSVGNLETHTRVLWSVSHSTGCALLRQKHDHVYPALL